MGEEEEVLVVVATLLSGMIVDSRNQIMGSAREQWHREHLSSPLGSGYGPGRTCGGYCSKGFLNYRKRSVRCAAGEKGLPGEVQVTQRQSSQR